MDKCVFISNTKKKCNHKAKFESPAPYCSKHWYRWFYETSKNLMSKALWRKLVKHAKKNGKPV